MSDEGVSVKWYQVHTAMAVICFLMAGVAIGWKAWWILAYDIFATAVCVFFAWLNWPREAAMKDESAGADQPKGSLSPLAIEEAVVEANGHSHQGLEYVDWQRAFDCLAKTGVGADQPGAAEGGIPMDDSTPYKQEPGDASGQQTRGGALERARAFADIWSEGDNPAFTKALAAPLTRQEAEVRALVEKFGFQSVLCGFDGKRFYYCKGCERREEPDHAHTWITKELVRHVPGCTVEALLNRPLAQEEQQ